MIIGMTDQSDEWVEIPVPGRITIKRLEVVGSRRDVTLYGARYIRFGTFATRMLSGRVGSEGTLTVWTTDRFGSFATGQAA
jgi:hypothetical protein